MTDFDAVRFQLQSTDDSGDVQKASGPGMASESFSDLMRAGHFGHAYNPPPGSHGLALSLRGEATLAVLLGLEHPKYRQKNLPVGASVLYDMNDNMIFCKLDNGIAISTKTGHVVVTSAAQIHLGAEPGGTSPVMTEAGPSSVVFAKV